MHGFNNARFVFIILLKVNLFFLVVELEPILCINHDDYLLDKTYNFYILHIKNQKSWNVREKELFFSHLLFDKFDGF